MTYQLSDGPVMIPAAWCPDCVLLARNGWTDMFSPACEGQTYGTLHIGNALTPAACTTPMGRHAVRRLRRNAKQHA